LKKNSGRKSTTPPSNKRNQLKETGENAVLKKSLNHLFLNLLIVMLVAGSVYPQALHTKAPVKPKSSTNATLEERISRIENGLLPMLILTGSPDPRMKLIERMKHYKTPGISIAVINDYKVEWTRSYGFLENGGNVPVTAETVFQAGSISKPVSAMAALRLVQEGKLQLDEDVNQKLTSWKVPENQFTKEQKVTLRRLVSHTAGMNVRGFDGYTAGQSMPTLLQVLNGEKPANSAPIGVDVQPNTQNRYSGGGFTVMQQLLIDVTRKPFQEFMQETILQKLNMKHSTFVQPLPDKFHPLAAIGHRASGEKLSGNWHSYPEMAAAALWSTPEDLAQFAIEIQKSHMGKSNKVLSKEMTGQMLTPQFGGMGLGIGLKGSPTPFRFSHSGSTEGYSCLLIGFIDSGKGAVIMTNSDNGNDLIMEVMRAIAIEYGWQDLQPEKRTVVPLDAKLYDTYTGEYDLGAGFTFVISSENGKLFGQPKGRSRAELLPESETDFFAMMPGIPAFKFVKDAKGQVQEMVLKQAGTERKGKKIK
jgi:CubicO group peptidase (beta-lactamase class C family)